MTDTLCFAYPARMTDEPLESAYIMPVTSENVAGLYKGRPADFLATLLATLGTILSVIGAIWFFAGFAENDTRPEHLASVFFLTASLFVLAIVPFTVVAGVARRAYLSGGQRRHYLLTLFLMLPWIVLGTLSVIHTPLPIWTGGIAILLSSLLSIWAFVSLILDIRNID